MHYVIGDVHGCYEEFMRLIKKIEREDMYAKFILIGDVIDRGADSVKMLTWCMEHIKEGGKYQMLMGNHELMFMEWCSSQWFPYCEGTKDGYEHAYYNTDEDLKKAGVLTEENTRKMFAFLKKLPLVMEKEVISPDGKQSYVLAHAWAKEEEMEQIRNKTKQPVHFFCTFLLDRSGIKKEAVYDENGTRILVHGHTPTISEEVYTKGGVPGRIVYRRHAINVDCGISHGRTKDGLVGNLAAICLENLNEYYAYSLQECYARTYTEGSSDGKQSVLEFKRKYHYSRPDMMRLSMIKQMNGEKQINLDKR